MSIAMNRVSNRVERRVSASRVVGVPEDNEIKVLFIGGNATPTSGADGNVNTFLENKYGAANVFYKQASAAVTEDAISKSLIVISSTPSSGDIRGKWNDSAVPVMNWEEAVMKQAAGDFQFSSGTNKPTHTSIRVVDDTHPIMRQVGFTNGLETIMSNAEQNCVDVVVAGGVDVLAENPPQAGCKVVTVADKGALGMDLVPFPERRGMFPITDGSFNNLNVNGLALFDAMLDWLTYRSEEATILLQENGRALLQENGRAILVEK